MPRLRSLATGVVVNLSDEQVAAGLTGFAAIDDEPAKDEKPAKAPAKRAVKASADDKE